MATRILKAVKSRIIKHSAGLKCNMYESIYRKSFRDKQRLGFWGEGGAALEITISTIPEDSKEYRVSRKLHATSSQSQEEETNTLYTTYLMSWGPYLDP